MVFTHGTGVNSATSRRVFLDFFWESCPDYDFGVTQIPGNEEIESQRMQIRDTINTI